MRKFYYTIKFYADGVRIVPETRVFQSEVAALEYAYSRASYLRNHLVSESIQVKVISTSLVLYKNYEL